MRPDVPRLLLRFALIGALAFGVKRLALPSPDWDVSVRVAADATLAERERALDEALLLEHAVRAGWSRTDAVVRERLLHAGSTLGAEGPASLRIELAHALGVHRTDPVARERLVGSARRALSWSASESPPTPDEVEHWTRTRSHDPARDLVRIEHRFLSRERRGTALARDSATLGDALARGEAAPSDSPPIGDGWVSPARLDALIGAGFGARAASAPDGEWTGPIESAFGAHFVRVVERRRVEVDGGAARAALEIREARRAARLREALEGLRRRTRVRWEEPT